MGCYKDIDECWLDRLQKGETEAFSLLYDRYSRLIYTLAYKYLQSKEDAEDAVQYTFMRVWEQRSRLDFTKGVRSLLYTILKNHILNLYRHEQLKSEKVNELSLDEQIDDSAIVAFEKRDFSLFLNHAIATLPPQKRKICQLKIDEGLTNQEIADQMSLSVYTVKSHYTTTIKKLRNMVSRLAFVYFFFYLCQ